MRWFWSILLVLSALLLAGCQKAGEDPTPTPDQASIQAASTLFAQPTRVTRPTPTVTPVNEVELELNRLVAGMERAVVEQDYDAYMAFIWDGDPMFWNEHSRWSQDWVDHPLSTFDIELFSISSETPDQARARMTIRWGLAGQTREGSAGGATVSVVFYREDGRWLWGGEDWHVLEVDGFRLSYFGDKTVNLEEPAQEMAAYLPGVHTVLTREFGYVPDQPAHIKLYESYPTLQTMTRLSMSQIRAWNEPGEAIKVTLDQNNQAPREEYIARQYTLFLLYSMADGTHGNFPWWLEQGAAAYGEARFYTQSQRNRIVQRVAALATASAGAGNQLWSWDEISTPVTQSLTSALPVADQAFTLVLYVTETYGQEARNAWLQAMASDLELAEATETHLGVSFEKLDTQWREWLLAQESA